MLKVTDIMQRVRSKATHEGTLGFALPTVLVLMMVLSTLSVFLLSSSSDAQRAGRAIRESARSFYAADAGVNSVLADWSSLSYDTLVPNPGDSADLGWTTLDNGAQYRAVLVRVDGGIENAIYSVRVVGRGAGDFGGSTTMFREISPTGTLFDADMAAAPGGISAGQFTATDDEWEGGNMVDGRDMIPSAWASEGICDALEDQPGIIWKNTSNVSISGGLIDGDPDEVQDTNMNSNDLYDFGGLDYDDLVAMADITYTGSSLTNGIGPVVSGGSCVTSVSTNWGDPNNPSSACFDYFPIVHFTNSTVQITDDGGRGQGILLIDGELEITGLDDEDFNFYGLIILKGPANGDGILLEGGKEGKDEVNVYGSVISNGDITLTDASLNYSQCAVERALAAHGLGTGGPGALTERVWRQVTN